MKGGTRTEEMAPWSAKRNNLLLRIERTKLKKEETMKLRSLQKIFTALIVALAIAAAVPGIASAIGTTSGTSIQNTPTVQFSVGGVNQPLYTAPTTSFVVDTKVIFTVQKTDAAPVSAAPSASNRMLTFQLANESNAPVRFLLAAANLASGATVTFGATAYNDSNIDTTNIPPAAFVDANTNGSYDAGEEYVTVPAGAVAQTATVLVSGNMPGAASGQVIAILLTVTAVDALGTPLVESASDTPGVDIVLADGAGTDDAARGGTFTDRSAYRIAAAIISVNKTATTIWDPYNYGAGGATAPGDPKTIPGALIRYQITIQNAATATDTAFLTTVADALSNNLAIDPDLKAAADAAVLSPESAAGSGFKVTGAGVGNSRAIVGAPAYFTTWTTADGVDHNNTNPGGTITATMTIVLPAEGTYQAGELRPGESVTITFNAIVQ